MYKFRFKKMSTGKVQVTLSAQYPYQAPMPLGTGLSETDEVADVVAVVVGLVATHEAQVQGLYTKWDADGAFA